MAIKFPALLLELNDVRFTAVGFTKQPPGTINNNHYSLKLDDDSNLDIVTERCSLDALGNKSWGFVAFEVARAAALDTLLNENYLNPTSDKPTTTTTEVLSKKPKKSS